MTAEPRKEVARESHSLRSVPRTPSCARVCKGVGQGSKERRVPRKMSLPQALGAGLAPPGKDPVALLCATGPQRPRALPAKLFCCL